MNWACSSGERWSISRRHSHCTWQSGARFSRQVLAKMLRPPSPHHRAAESGAPYVVTTPILVMCFRQGCKGPCELRTAVIVRPVRVPVTVAVTRPGMSKDTPGRHTRSRKPVRSKCIGRHNKSTTGIVMITALDV
jgi:hypothetical protein